MVGRFMERLRRPARSLLAAAFLGAGLGVACLGAFADALADAPKGGYPPDPPPHPSRNNWVFEMSAVGGKVTLNRVKAVTYEKPTETPRVVGRFALELYIGPELLDRVRFNVPLMGGESGDGNRNGLPKPRFDQNVTVKLTARMADSPRAAYLLLVDRETGDVQKLFWPPEKDGRVLPWKNGLSAPSPGDFPDGGIRAVGRRESDGGAPQAPAPSDAGGG
jgi:hypothetical protein